MTTSRRHASGLLAHAVESVLSQTFADFEFVICDDASSDGTASYLEGLQRADSRVKLIRNERNVNSVAVSLGRCLLASDPDRPFVTWMFDDCVLRPKAFEQLAQRLSTDPTLDMVFGTTVVHRKDAPPFKVGHATPQAIRERIDFSAKLVPNAAILVSRSLFDTVGWYDTNVLLRRSCDWDLFRRVIRHGARFDSLGEELCDEWGGQQPDSLRNSFTTTFALMKKFVTLRDRGAWDLDLDSVLRDPVDRIPAGDWTEDETRLCQYIFLEYFLSVVELDRAAVWARRLLGGLEDAPFYLERLEEAGAGDPAAMGAFCGSVWGAYRAKMARDDGGNAGRTRSTVVRRLRGIIATIIRARRRRKSSAATGP